jgi:tetratricopeptide (TPR) repeat protein
LVVIPVGVILAFMWLPSLVDTGLSGLMESMTGGREQIVPTPFYFRTQALRKRGEFSAALAELDAELVKFPQDQEGHLLKAEILADDQKEVTAALAVLSQFEELPGLDAGKRNVARFRRVDLLQVRLSDFAAAEGILNSILSEDPTSSAAQVARQRLAHATSAAGTSAARGKLIVTRHSESLGLSHDLGASRILPENPAAQASELLKHLESHPGDWEARERLATLYADQFGHVPLAVAQLRELISQPHQPQKRVAGWLQRVAAIHLQPGGTHSEARLALEEIQDRFPNSVWSEQAALKIATLGNPDPVAIAPKGLKLGQYEQNIGLKRGSSQIPDPNPDSAKQ